jgi:hypothetical protein
MLYAVGIGTRRIRIMTGVLGGPWVRTRLPSSVACIQGAAHVLTYPPIGRHEHDTIMQFSIRWDRSEIE